jgi:hypothetical protein
MISATLSAQGLRAIMRSQVTLSVILDPRGNPAESRKCRQAKTLARIRKEVKIMDENTKSWIKRTLSNDELSSDKELLEFFMKDGSLSYKEAARWLALRLQYRVDPPCEAEPSDK